MPKKVLLILEKKTSKSKVSEQIPHQILRHLLIKEDDHIANCVIEFFGEEEGWGEGFVAPI